MNFTQAAKPYVTQKLNEAHKLFTDKDDEAGFTALEDAHVIGQHSTYHHTRVHYEMLKFGLKRKDFIEVFGQLFRLIGAVTKTAIGLLPEGNTGGASVSPFKLMPLSPANKVILDKIKHAQS
ncbi:uncharacterized protein DUF3703 [Alteromonas sp. 76-1]|jgi:hypothetical protein|uniref:DUF3703 domain-containing protein n=1 Tax=unclassified Alteromonas TaxID=2614992 RepID=UPI00050985E5|nr:MULTISPECIES: DUF3703 domain-containing protein [unclassified Alteromonas]VEL97184.1 uncharacterized protein DUF3703 [Alteromonas sp. 76-1]